MTTEEISFRISESVALQTEFFQSYTPPVGSTIEILEIIAEASYNSNSEVRVVWDYEGEQEFLWTMRGSSKFYKKIIIDASKTDGTKKLALVADNGELSSLTISAFMSINVVT